MLWDMNALKRRHVVCLNEFEYVGVSLATAHTLGLKKIKLEVECQTAYILVGSVCHAKCGFCGMSKKTERGLSRVKWPLFSKDVVLEALREGVFSRKISRICLQVTCSDTQELLREMIKVLCQLDIPISLSKSVTSVSEIEDYLELGVCKITVNLDIITEKSYLQYKGINFKEKKKLLFDTAKKFPKKIVCHLIIGFDESEQECIELLDELSKVGVTVGLFAFFPIKGTELENHSQPDVGKYRRVQIAKHLIEKGVGIEQFKFDEQGKLQKIESDLGAETEQLAKAFQTTGCEGCSRPYYTEKPRGTLYNFPYKPNINEVEQCMKESGLWK